MANTSYSTQRVTAPPDPPFTQLPASCPTNVPVKIQTKTPDPFLLRNRANYSQFLQIKSVQLLSVKLESNK